MRHSHTCVIQFFNPHTFHNNQSHEFLFQELILVFFFKKSYNNLKYFCKNQKNHFELLNKIKINTYIIILKISFFRQIIPLVILEEGSYEKDVLFYVNLGEPQMIGGNYFKKSLFFC